MKNEYMELTDSRILITGGAGFIGSHLTEQPLADENEVVVLDNFENSDPSRIPEDAELLEGDPTDSTVVSEAIDGVFHLAARKSVNDENPRQQFEENTAMTHNVLKAMDDAGVSEIAFTSSSDT